MNEGTIYEISSIKAPKVKTTMLVYGEAKNTIINLVIGQNVQTYIKIKASDLVRVLEEMGIVRNDNGSGKTDVEFTIRETETA